MISVISVQILEWVSMRTFLCGKIYFEAKISNQNNWLQNNTAQLYLILGRAEQRWYFSSILKHASDIHRFSNIFHTKIWTEITDIVIF